MDFKFDYLTFSIKPNFEICNNLLFMDWLIDFLKMQDKRLDFQLGKSGGFYDQKLYYHNIYIKSPPPEKPEQGFLVEMTGEGYDYYIEYRKKQNPSFTERSFFADILSLQELDIYKINITRLDVAIDDIAYDNDEYLLDFDTIRQSVLEGELVTRFRHRTIVTGGEIQATVDSSTPFQIYEKGSRRSKIKGSTIYLGKRENTHCRFYDKVAESKAHEKEIDENITHWMRFELQAKNDNAMAIVTQFVNLPAEEFSPYLSNVLLDMVRFIDPEGETLSSNYYRCPVKSWWSKFLGTVQTAKLIHKKPKYNKFVRAVNFIENTCAATLYALGKVGGLTLIHGLIKSGSEKHYKSHHRQIEDDYIEYGNFEIDKLSGVDKYKLYFENDNYYRKFLVELRKHRDETTVKLMERAKRDQEEYKNSFSDFDDWSECS